MKYADLIRSPAKEPLQGETLPWQRGKHGVIKGKHRSYYKGCEEKEEIKKYKKPEPR